MQIVQCEHLTSYVEYAWCLNYIFGTALLFEYAFNLSIVWSYTFDEHIYIHIKYICTALNLITWARECKAYLNIVYR